jgi:hypothetical protein
MSNNSNGCSKSACWILQIAFIAIPIIAGVDKYFNVLTDWSKYIAPWASNILQGYDWLFMYIVGAVEIAAGLGMIFLPRIFSYIVSAWLLLIAINLVSQGPYYDVGLRDFGLCFSAAALATLCHKCRR